MTTTTPTSFTVTVDHNGHSYDVEVTPTFNGARIEGIGDRLDQWNEAERTHKVFSRTLQKILTQSNVPDSHLTAGVLTVGQGRGIILNDATHVNDDATKRVCDTFINYLQDPNAGIAELGAPDDAASTDGLGVTLRVKSNAYLESAPDVQKATRLSLFKKKCQEYYGANDIAYTGLELSCRTYLLKQRERSSRANSSEAVDKKKQLEREIKEWFVHKYLLVAETNATVTTDAMQRIEGERNEFAAIHREVKAAASSEAERRSLGDMDEENPLNELDEFDFET
ncbi:MAG TPA: hypothetical protein VFU89_04475 [Rhabdochlamydiaceae bacterium]|nr:hypothetical protein [Rhabdochlamydiaceae bacterium]